MPTTNGSVRSVRILADRGVIRERCNCAGSIYHSLQLSLEKRLSRNFLLASHYTWSTFIDAASDPFNPSVSGEIALPQHPYDRPSERARSTYDRPHRFSTNGVFELPFFRPQRGLTGCLLGGWQLNGFLTLQSGAPFGVLNGTEPGGVGTGNLVGTAIRPFLNTNIPADWVKTSTALHVPLPDIGYGYLWWKPSQGRQGPAWANSFLANGHYGQFILVLPAIDTVIVHRRAVPDKLAIARNLGRTEGVPAGGSVPVGDFLAMADKVVAAHVPQKVL